MELSESDSSCVLDGPEFFDYSPVRDFSVGFNDFIFYEVLPNFKDLLDFKKAFGISSSEISFHKDYDEYDSEITCSKLKVYIHSTRGESIRFETTDASDDAKALINCFVHMLYQWFHISDIIKPTVPQEFDPEYGQFLTKLLSSRQKGEWILNLNSDVEMEDELEFMDVIYRNLMIFWDI